MVLWPYLPKSVFWAYGKFWNANLLNLLNLLNRTHSTKNELFHLFGDFLMHFPMCHSTRCWNLRNLSLKYLGVLKTFFRPFSYPSLHLIYFIDKYSIIVNRFRKMVGLNSFAFFGLGRFTSMNLWCILTVYIDFICRWRSIYRFMYEYWIVERISRGHWDISSWWSQSSGFWTNKVC